MFEIIPSPGTDNKNWEEIDKKIGAVESFAKTIHIDVIDGIYVNNKTFSDPTPFLKYAGKLKSGRRGQMEGESGLVFEVHLMVDNPIQYIKPFSEAGFQRFIGQIEKMPDQEEFVAQAQMYGEAALALDKQSPVDSLKISLEDLDAILVMTIQAGFSGQKFEEGLLEKVRMIRSKNEYLPIEVDGGINDETIDVAAAAGANRFVATSFLYSMGSPISQYKMLIDKLKSLEVPQGR